MTTKTPRPIAEGLQALGARSNAVFRAALRSLAHRRAGGERDPLVAYTALRHERLDLRRPQWATVLEALHAVVRQDAPLLPERCYEAEQQEEWPGDARRLPANLARSSRHMGGLRGCKAGRVSRTRQ